MDPALKELADTAASLARNSLRHFTGLIDNEDAVHGTWGSFDTWILQKLEPNEAIAAASAHLHREAERLDEINGFGNLNAVEAQKHPVSAAIDHLEREILRSGRLTLGASAIF